MNLNDRCKHRRYVWDGTIIGIIRNPYFAAMAPRIQVRFTVGGHSFNRLCHPDDIDVIGPIAPVTPPPRRFDLPPHGAIHDAVLDTLERAIADDPRRAGWRNVRPGLAVIDGGLSR